MKPIEDRFWEKVYPEALTGCYLWGGSINSKGYGSFSIGTHAKPKSILAHRFAYELQFGKIVDGLMACHRCDVPLCVRPDHIFLGTQGDNIRDMESKGRSVHYSGEMNGRAKLTWKDVEEIRSIGRLLPARKLAPLYGVSSSMIYYVLDNSNWKRPTELALTV